MARVPLNTQNFINDMYKIYVEEYATLYIVSVKKFSSALPCAIGWKYRKKDGYKTASQAAQAAVYELSGQITEERN